MSYPRLYIGEAACEFRRKVRVPRRSVFNGEDLVRIIDHYTGLSSLSVPLVIEDLSFLGEREQSLLLKFVEESSLRVVLLSKYDNIIPTIVSRMKLIHKYTSNITSNFLPAGQGRVRVEESFTEGGSYLDRVRRYGMESPVLYYYESLASGVPLSQRVISLLGA